MQTINNENVLDESALLVSETDSRGIILYANEVFLEASEYSLAEMIGKPHNIIRHPDMPRAAFKDMWETIKRGEVWQGFVKNRTKNNRFYWVYATIFRYGADHFLSVRKKAHADEIEKYTKIYAKMRAEETK